MTEDRKLADSGLIDKVAGKAKQALGNIAGDDELAAEGRLQHDKGEAVGDSRRLDEQAAQAKAETDLEARQEANRLQRERLEAESAAQRQEEQADRARQEEEARIEQAASVAEASVEQRAEMEEAALDRAQRDVAVDHGEAVADSVRLRREAAEAEMVADALATAQDDIESQPGG